MPFSRGFCAKFHEADGKDVFQPGPGSSDPLSESQKSGTSSTLATMVISWA